MVIPPPLMKPVKKNGKTDSHEFNMMVVNPSNGSNPKFLFVCCIFPILIISSSSGLNPPLSTSSSLSSLGGPFMSSALVLTSVSFLKDMLIESTIGIELGEILYGNCNAIGDD